MEPLTLKEFAENLRLSGSWREMEFADEILQLITLEDDVAEPYSELCGDLEHAAPDGLKEKPAKALEWLVDRSDMLGEIEKALAEGECDVGSNGNKVDADAAVKELLKILGSAEDILEDHGWTSGDFLSGLAKLAENAPTPLEYDL